MLAVCPNSAVIPHSVRTTLFRVAGAHDRVATNVGSFDDVVTGVVIEQGGGGDGRDQGRRSLRMLISSLSFKVQASTLPTLKIRKENQFGSFKSPKGVQLFK